MDTAKITITGTMPLLMHADSIDWADAMEDWKNDPENKAKSKAGDDRTPPYRWVGYLNYDDPQTGVVTIPSEYIMRSIMGGAAMVPTGKKQGTFKSLSQSGLLCVDFHWPLLVNGRTIPMAEINKIKTLPSYRDQAEAVKALGFTLFAKRAAVGQAKHVRIRPRFDNWSTTGEMLITDDVINKRTLQTILDLSGRLKGLGDWRPGAPKTPGQFGTYRAVVE